MPDTWEAITEEMSVKLKKEAARLDISLEAYLSLLILTQLTIASNGPQTTQK